MGADEEESLRMEEAMGFGRRAIGTDDSDSFAVMEVKAPLDAGGISRDDGLVGPCVVVFLGKGDEVGAGCW